MELVTVKRKECSYHNSLFIGLRFTA